MARAHPDIPGLVDWRPLARGGFSMVWQARQETLDRLVAVKVDHRTLNDEKERRRFLREAGSAGRLSGHPGIVTVHDAGILPDDRPFLVMDLCPGGSLTRWLKPEGRQDQGRILSVGIRIADALAAAHARGVLHRDVKPANILIDSYDQPGLADFGLAAIPESGMEMSVTLEGMTPAYAPKEVFYRKAPTEYGDVYSLAATLYALFQGRPPRWPETGSASVPELLELQREPIERLPQVSEPFMDALISALDDDPQRRPTASRFRDLLAAVELDTAPVGEASAVQGRGARGSSLEPVTDAGRAERQGRRNRRLLAFVLAAAVLVVALLLSDLFRAGPSVLADPGAVSASATTGLSTTSAASAGQSASAPSNSAPPPAPSADRKTAAPVPAGFVDCSAQLGGHSFCLTDPECWTDIYQYADVLKVGVMQECDAEHAQQTFAAGTLNPPENRESRFEAREEVQALCTRDVLNRVLAGRKALKDWQVSPLPVQVTIDDDNFYRCLVSIPGGSSRPLKLKVPSS